MTKILYVWAVVYSLFFNSIAFANGNADQVNLISSGSINDIEMITNGTSVAKSIVYGDGTCNRACKRTAKKFSKAFVRSIKERGIDQVDTDEEFGYLSTELLNMVLSSIDKLLKKSGANDKMKNFFEDQKLVDTFLRNILTGLQTRGYNKYVKFVVGGVLVVGLLATGVGAAFFIAVGFQAGAGVGFTAMAAGGALGGYAGVKIKGAIYDNSLPNKQVEIITENGDKLRVDYQEVEIEDNGIY